MVEGRQRSEWDRTAHLLAMIYNAHRDQKSRPMKPAEFHPFDGRKTPVAKIKDLSILKQVFVKE